MRPQCIISRQSLCELRGSDLALNSPCCSNQDNPAGAQIQVKCPPSHLERHDEELTLRYEYVNMR